MKTLNLFSVFMIVSIISFGQSVDPSVIATAGNYSENGSIAVSYTIGQTVTATLTNGGILTQGFQQDSYIIVEIPEQSSQEFSVNIYPIPTTNEITVEFNSDFQGNAKIAIIDELGRTLSEKDVNTSVNKISLNGLSESYYFLKVSYLGNFKTYKIQKINQ
ncbi:MAG: hypothetical protein DRP35_06770 [Candidatus Zixiibacteriota bacterium]|nr:MAG: hypothetical protein DRP35_06770 [candidate division Zixibacteria bacterium]